jgi:hypothetical protein
LALESCDLSPTETKVNKIEAEQVHKLELFSLKMMIFFSNLTNLTEKKWFSQLVFNNNYFWFQLEINHVIHEPTAKN